MLFAIIGAIWTIGILCIPFCAIYLYKLHKNRGETLEYTWDAPRLWMLYILGISIFYLGTARLANSLSAVLMNELNQHPIPFLLPEQWLNLAGICAVIAFLIGMLNRGERIDTTLPEVNYEVDINDLIIRQRDPLLLPELRQLEAPTIYPEDANTYLEPAKSPTNVLDNMVRRKTGPWRIFRSGLVPSFLTTLGILFFIMSALLVFDRPTIFDDTAQSRSAAESAAFQQLAAQTLNTPNTNTVIPKTVAENAAANEASANDASTNNELAENASTNDDLANDDLANIALGKPADFAVGDPTDFMNSDPSNLLISIRAKENISDSVGYPVPPELIRDNTILDSNATDTMVDTTTADNTTADNTTADNLKESAPANIALGEPADFAIGNPANFMNSDPSNLIIPAQSTESPPVDNELATIEKSIIEESAIDESAIDESVIVESVNEPSINSSTFYTTSIPLELIPGNAVENQTETVDTPSTATSSAIEIPAVADQTAAPAPTPAPILVAIVGNAYDVNARLSPSEDSAIITIIPSGTIMPIKERLPNGEWILVTLDDGRSAWVAVRVVEIALR